MTAKNVFVLTWAYLVLLSFTYAAFALSGAFVYWDLKYLAIVEWYGIVRLAFLAACVWHACLLHKAAKRKGMV